MITKGVIAVAGSGTRFLPATKTMPKEMLPIVDKPIIQYVVEEMVDAGITDIIMVTRWDKKSLEDHFDRSYALEHDLEKTGKLEKLKQIKRISELANFIYIRQKGPYGTGTPVISAKSMIGEDEPFVFALGDDLVKSEISFTKQLIENYEKNKSMVIGVQEVLPSEVSKYGILKVVKENECLIVKNLIEKPTQKQAPSLLAQFGRFVLTPEIFKYLDVNKLGKDNELWLTDALIGFIKDGGKVSAQEINNGKWFTTGDPLNFLKATVEYALDKSDIKMEFREYLKEVKNC
ncbi:MAG: UTP--glucose-1-phosphate uridylyltransferase [bacterium]